MKSQFQFLTPIISHFSLNYIYLFPLHHIFLRKKEPRRIIIPGSCEGRTLFLPELRTAKGTGIPALLLGTLAQLVSPWYFGMITAFIPK